MPTVAKLHGTCGRPLAGFVRQIAGVFGHGTVEFENDPRASDGSESESELEFDLSDLGLRLRPSSRPPAFASVDYAPRWG